MLLVGLMATGKSSVAQAVAAATGWPSLDNDLVLERSNGRTAAQILAADGLAQLRRAESQVLTLTLSMPSPLVAGVAAGVVLDPRDRERLRAGGHVVWLKASPATIVRRLTRGSHRPFLDADPEATLTAMAAERDPLFAEVAHQVLDMDLLTPVQAARQVLSAVSAVTD